MWLSCAEKTQAPSVLATGKCQTTIQWMTALVCDHQANGNGDGSDELIQPGFNAMCLIQTEKSLLNMNSIQRVSGILTLRFF